jgi:hypothetical protein
MGYELHRDHKAEALMQLVPPPPNWVLYQVKRFSRHKYTPPEDDDRCVHCQMLLEAHLGTETIMRQVILLRDGPVRRLVFLTDNRLDLQQEVGVWLYTMMNLTDVIGHLIQGFIAYDGKGNGEL